MKRISLIILIAILSPLSCKKIDKEAIYGNWKLYEIAHEASPEYDQFHIAEDTIITFDEYLFPEKWSYEFKRDELQLRSKKATTQSIKIDKLVNDSMWIKGNKYLKTQGNHLDCYDLISVSTSEKLVDKTDIRPMHLYKDLGSKNLIIRCEEKKTPLQDIPLFNYSHSQKNPQVLIFLGSNLMTADLIKVYGFLNYTGIRKVTLITNKNAANVYEVFIDRIDLWKEQVLEIVGVHKNQMPPPSPFVQATKQELLDLNIPVIKIDRAKDLDKINYKFGDRRVLVSIASTIPLEEYLLVKIRLKTFSRKIGTNLWTEFL